jgi:hypothetical protein
MRPLIKGPRSLMRTTTSLPSTKDLTRTRVPKGKVLCAAVSSLVLKRSPLAVTLPWKRGPYHEAIPDSVDRVDDCTPAAGSAFAFETKEGLEPLCTSCVSALGRPGVLAKDESAGTVAAGTDCDPTPEGGDATVDVAGTGVDLGTTLHALTAASSAAATAQQARRCAF